MFCTQISFQTKQLMTLPFLNLVKVDVIMCNIYLIVQQIELICQPSVLYAFLLMIMKALLARMVTSMVRRSNYSMNAAIDD